MSLPLQNKKTFQIFKEQLSSINNIIYRRKTPDFLGN